MIARVGRTPLGAVYRSPLGALRRAPAGGGGYLAVYDSYSQEAAFLPSAGAPSPLTNTQLVDGALASGLPVYRVFGASQFSLSASIGWLDPTDDKTYVMRAAELQLPAREVDFTASNSSTDIELWNNALIWTSASTHAGITARHLAVLDTTELESGSPVTRSTLFAVPFTATTTVATNYTVTLGKERLGLAATTLSVTIPGAPSGATSARFEVLWIRTDRVKLYALTDLIWTTTVAPNTVNNQEQRLVEIDTATGAITTLITASAAYTGTGRSANERLTTFGVYRHGFVERLPPQSDPAGLHLVRVVPAGIVVNSGSSGRFREYPDTFSVEVVKVVNGIVTTQHTLAARDYDINDVQITGGYTPLRRSGVLLGQTSLLSVRGKWLYMECTRETDRTASPAQFTPRLSVIKEGVTLENLVSAATTNPLGPSVRAIVPLAANW